MAVPEVPAGARRQVEESVTGPAAELIERLAERLGGRASVSVVFGEPVVHADVTVIPVAKVGFGLGVGRGRDLVQGGGGGVSAAPVGYIEISGGGAVFKPTRDPMTSLLVPLAVLGAGSLAWRVVRGFVRRR